MSNEDTYVERMKEIIPKFLNSESYDYDCLTQELNRGLPTLKKYLQNNDLILEIFGFKVLKLVQKKKELCDIQDQQKRKQQVNDKKANKILEFLEYYSNSRYPFKDLLEEFHLTIYQSLASIIEKYEDLSGKALDADLYERVMARYNEKIYMTTKQTGNLYLVQEPSLLALLKPDRITVTSLEKKQLQTIDCFLKNSGSISRVIESLERSYNSIYVDLTSSLEDLVKPEIIDKINYYIRIENILTGNHTSLKEKKELIQKVLEVFIQSSFNIEKTGLETGFDSETVYRILKDPSVNVFLKDPGMRSVIHAILVDYCSQQENVKGNRK